MVLITGNWRIALAGIGASLVIFAVVFFAVIKPSENTANQAVKSGLRQSQQALSQAQKQLSTAAGVASVAAPQGQQTLSSTSQLAGCLEQAGTDTASIDTCQSKFGQ